MRARSTFLDDERGEFCQDFETLYCRGGHQDGFRRAACRSKDAETAWVEPSVDSVAEGLVAPVFNTFLSIFCASWLACG